MIGIVGGGIGGLTLAIALARQGLQTRVFERRPDFGDPGAGIVLGPNAMQVMDGLGLGEDLQAAGVHLARLEVTDASERPVQEIVYVARQTPTRAVAIHRAALHRVLLDHQPAPPRMGSEIQAIDAGDTGATLTLEDGSTERFDLLVGADGIGSQVRAEVFGDTPRRYSGQTCWRIVVDHDAEVATEMWGRGKRLGIVPIGPGRTYLFLVANATARAPSPFETVAGLRAFFAEFRGRGARALDAITSLDALQHNDLEDLWAPAWHRGRTVLIGDAAHAVTPNMGQGAGMAIEDVASLGRALHDHGIGTPALAAFQAERMPRAGTVHRRSWWLGRMAQAENGLFRFLRNQVLRWVPRSLAQREVDRLVADAPALPRLDRPGATR